LALVAGQRLRLKTPLPATVVMKFAPAGLTIRGGPCRQCKLPTESKRLSRRLRLESPLAPTTKW
jgi:hypothetical protein